MSSTAHLPDATSAAAIPFHNTYARLPDTFFARTPPAPVRAPRLLAWNRPLAVELGIDPAWFSTADAVAVLSGNRVAEGSEPLAIAYAGHQFGHFVPLLGDGRANLLGEVVARDGVGYDIQLKGSGPTPFSRRGDGRAALGPVLREYLVSEAMAALGVPTTRALAAVATGERVARESMLPGAVITRVAASHVRVGTFQYFAAREDLEGLRTLATYAMRRHYPQALAATRPVRAFLEAVIGRHARLVAQWMTLGFIHGVMNTDNTSISGETLDYGPCAFLEAYEPGKVFSSIDARGRYAYSNQPHAAHWNLTRLAEALVPLLQEEEGTEDAAIASAVEALATFAPQYDGAREAGFRRKLGLATQQPGDTALIDDLLQCMSEGAADFTLTFRRLADLVDVSGPGPRALFDRPDLFDRWSIQWKERVVLEPGDRHARADAMRAVNPLVIPRNHNVAAMIDAAVERDDYGPFEALLTATATPFAQAPDADAYSIPALPDERVTQTFCGT